LAVPRQAIIVLRWSKILMLGTCGHVMTGKKTAAQGSMLERIMPKADGVQSRGLDGC
jgi:hypothetical protein